MHNYLVVFPRKGCSGCMMLIRALLASAGKLLVMAHLLGASAVMAAEPLTISVSQSPLSLPLFVAEQEGYFAAEGVQVKFNEVIGGHRTLQQILNGEADLATSSEAVVMFNSFKTGDFALLATFVTSNNDVKVVVRPGANIFRPRDLIGKRVGTVVGSASHYYLDTFLLFHGINQHDVQLVNLQPEAMAPALKKGDVDAFVIWEPVPFKALQSVEGATILKDPGVYMLTFNLLVHRKYIGVRDNDLVKILRALNRAESFIKAEPQKAQAILRTRLKLDQTFIDWIWPHYNYRLSLDQSVLVTLESEARWARTNGHVSAARSPNYLDFVYAKPLRKTNPGAVGIME